MGFSSQVGAVFVAGLVSFAGCAMSAFACETLTPGPKGRVVEITDGDTFILDNSQKVRLIGMQAPKLPLGRIGFDTWPLAEEAKDFLADFALGENVQVFYGSTRKDRHGRVLGHVFVDGERQKWAQKAVIAKWLARNPRVVVLDEPTRGIDVGARSSIYDVIAALAEEGVAVIVVSSDLEEVLGVSNRVMVMAQGRQAGILDRDKANDVSVMELATI